MLALTKNIFELERNSKTVQNKPNILNILNPIVANYLPSVNK